MKIRLRMTAVLLAVCLAMGGCGTKEDDPQEQTAVTINGEAITLREWNFYLRMNQMQWEKSYLDSYGDEMWSREVGEDGRLLSDSLKEDVLEIIRQIHLADQHAEEYGVALDEEQQEELRAEASGFMEAYNEALLKYAGADEAFVYSLLCDRELSSLVAEAAVEAYEPVIDEEDVHREGICYVLISTTGLRDNEGNMTPFSEEEVERRTQVAQELCIAARKSGDLKSAAEAEGLTPIESSMGNTNEGDGQEPRMLDAARELQVGEISDPIQTKEGWFLVQHTSAYDAEGTEYWRAYLTDQEKEAEYARILEEWETSADIIVDEEVIGQAEVKIVLKELL